MHVKSLALTLAILGVPVASFGSSYDQIVAFGDSLSDSGNNGPGDGTNYATRDLPDGAGGTYAVSYYTDGTNTTPATSGTTGLWVDQLAADLHVADPAPFSAPTGGTNYAVSSADTSFMQTELGFFSADHPTAPANALYTMWGGSNDLRNGEDPTQAADNIASQIQQLSLLGAKHFLWLNLPALGDTPAGAAQDQSGLNAATDAFNAEWITDLAGLKAQGIDVTGVDVHTLFDNILATPSAYGFTNTTDAADLAPDGTNPDTYVSWDGLHPTTAADQLVANLAFADIPEPVSAGMMGVAGLALLARRRR